MFLNSLFAFASFKHFARLSNQDFFQRHHEILIKNLLFFHTKQVFFGRFLPLIKRPPCWPFAPQELVLLPLFAPSKVALVCDGGPMHRCCVGRITHPWMVDSLWQD